MLSVQKVLTHVVIIFCCVIVGIVLCLPLTSGIHSPIREILSHSKVAVCELCAHNVVICELVL